MKHHLLAALLGSLCLPGLAHADMLISGGLNSSTGTGLTDIAGVPSWRLGGNLSDRLVLWGSANYLSFDAEVPDNDDYPVSGWAMVPRLGLRYDTQARKKGNVVPYGAASLYSMLGSLQSGDSSDDADLAPKMWAGATAGVGLDASISKKLSISAELGADAFRGVIEDKQWDQVNEVNYVRTYGAAYVNIWL